MAKSSKQGHPIRKEFKIVEELQDFWGIHSAADYDLFKDVRFDVDLQSQKNLVAVEPALMKELVNRAHTMGVSTETLVNPWLSKQLQSQS